MDYILLSNMLKFFKLFTNVNIYHIYLPTIADFISFIGYTEMIISAFILYFSLMFDLEVNLPN